MNLLTQTDASYKEWLQSLGQRWQQSQIKAAVKVNSELLRFNWALGRDIATLHMEAKYGSGFYQTLSRDLQQLLPGARSFSVTNLRYMRHFYEMYPAAGERQQLVGTSPADIRRHFAGGDVSNPQQLVEDLKENALQQSGDGAVSNFQQLVGDLKDEIIFYIPWGHHTLQPDTRQCRGGPCARPSPLAMGAGDHKGRPYKTGYSMRRHLAARTTPVGANNYSPLPRIKERAAA